MKKNFGFYASIWAILFIALNTIIFFVRSLIPGYVTYFDASFWCAWVCILVAFIGNLACAYVAFKSDNLTKVFYNLPLISLSESALISMVVVGGVLMLIPNCLVWISAVICIVILVFNMIALIKARWVAEAVGASDEKVKTKTSFTKNLTDDANHLLANATTPEAKNACKKVYEAVRYSDPMSSDALADIENQILLKFNEFSDAVTGGSDNINALADEIVVLIGDRNKKCKMLK